MHLLLAAAIAASTFTGTGIHAAPFPATSVAAASRDASNPVENTYQESATASCSSGLCVMTFPATTKSKTLVSHVSCFFQIPSSATVFSAELASKTGSEGNFLGVEKYSSVSGFAGYVVNAPTYLFFASGEQPTVTVVGTGASVSSFTCTISGNYH